MNGHEKAQKTQQRRQYEADYWVYCSPVRRIIFSLGDVCLFHFFVPLVPFCGSLNRGF